MSDCSTNAMKPKEPPRTCGNHRMWRERKDTLEQRCQQNDSTLADAIKHLDELLSKDRNLCNECRIEHEQLRRWLLELNSLRQRNQQLEQVANRMYGFMNLIFNDLGIEPTFTSAVTHEVMSLPRFREQLEALGVSLDD